MSNPQVVTVLQDIVGFRYGWVFDVASLAVMGGFETDACCGDVHQLEDVLLEYKVPDGFAFAGCGLTAAAIRR